MTLIFDKNGKRDMRLHDYEQACVRAGLAKAEAERELERAGKDLVEMQNRRSQVFAEIEAKRKEWESDLKAFEERRVRVHEEIVNSIRRETQEFTEWQKREEKAIASVGEKKAELEKLTEYLGSLDSQIESKTKKISELDKAAEDARVELAKVREELSPAKRELEDAQSELNETVRLKVQVNKELNDAYIEKTEVEQQVALLKSDNKGGLDVIASLEGERARLKGREEALDRKEADLLVYEKRLAKRAQDLGVDLKMTFN